MSDFTVPGCVQNKLRLLMPFSQPPEEVDVIIIGILKIGKQSRRASMPFPEAPPLESGERMHTLEVWL